MWTHAGLARGHARWIIDDGKSTRVLNDSWVSPYPLRLWPTMFNTAIDCNIERSATSSPPRARGMKISFKHILVQIWQLGFNIFLWPCAIKEMQLAGGVTEMRGSEWGISIRQQHEKMSVSAAAATHGSGTLSPPRK